MNFKKLKHPAALIIFHFHYRSPIHPPQNLLHHQNLPDHLSHHPGVLLSIFCTFLDQIHRRHALNYSRTHQNHRQRNHYPNGQDQSLQSLHQGQLMFNS